MIVLVAVALVVVPVAMAEFPIEVGRWYLAAAIDMSLDCDFEGAIGKVDRAISLNPSDPELYQYRAGWKLRTMQLDSGLDDCDSARMLLLQSRQMDAKTDKLLESVASLRSVFLQHLNRHPEAVMEWKQLVSGTDQTHDGRLAHRLNGLAYSRALGKIDLEIGVEEADRALEILGNRAVILDPGGYLHFAAGCSALKNDQKSALMNLSAAAGRAEDAYQAADKRARALESGMRNAFRYEERLRVLKPHLAGILAVRATLLHEIGRGKDAERDRLRMKELSENGNISVAEPVDLTKAIQRVMSASNTLDTRGFLYYQMGDLSAARDDLVKAVEMAEWAEKAFPWYIESKKHTILDMRTLERGRELKGLTTAVTRYHRMLVYEALGMKEEANKDRKAILAAGHEPGDHLF